MNIRNLFGVILAVCITAGLARADMQVGGKPTLKFNDFLTKSPVDLADYKGKIVVVDFWATWCKPCMAEAAHMVAVNEKYSSKGLQFIGVSLDSDASQLKPVIAAKNFTWPMLFEAGKGTTPSAWGITGIPQTFIIGPDGTVLWRGHPAGLDEPLATAFKEHPPVLVDPKVLEQAKSALDQAEKNLADGQPVKAMKLLATVPDAAKLDGEVTTRFTADSAKLQDLGNSELAAVDPMIQSEQYMLALSKLRDLSAAFAGTPIATAAKSKLVSLGSNPKVQKAIEAEKAEKTAGDDLAAANSLKSEKKDDLAYPKFKSIVKTYPGTTAATEAAAAVKAYEANTVFFTKFKNDAIGKKAESLMQMGDNYKAIGNADLAKAKYQAVIDQFPGTTWADSARKALSTLGG